MQLQETILESESSETDLVEQLQVGAYTLLVSCNLGFLPLS